MHFTFKPMDEADARAIQAWRYEGPYSVYNRDDDDGGIPAMLDRHSPYYAVQDDKGELIGFFCFGSSAQVWDSGEPHLYAVQDDKGELIGFFCFGSSAQVWDSGEPHLYSENNTITVGLGMRPDLVGKGLGLAFVNAGLAFAKEQFKPDYFRLFVLTFNERAGFQRVGIYEQHTEQGDHDFLEMSRKA